MNYLLGIGLAVLIVGLCVVEGLWTGYGGLECGYWGLTCAARALLALPVVLICAAVLLLKGAAAARAAADHSAIWKVLGVIVALFAAASMVPVGWMMFVFATK